MLISVDFRKSMHGFAMDSRTREDFILFMLCRLLWLAIFILCRPYLRAFIALFSIKVYSLLYSV